MTVKTNWSSESTGHRRGYSV